MNKTKEKLNHRQRRNQWLPVRVNKGQGNIGLRENKDFYGIMTDFIFLGPKSLQTVTTGMKLKDGCSLEEKL